MPKLSEILKFFENNCKKDFLVWIASYGKELHLAPVCFVLSREDKLVIAYNFVKKTVENIKKNPKVAVGVAKKVEGGFDGYLVKGRAEIHEKGEFFEEIKEFVEKESGGRRSPKAAIVVYPEKVYSLKPGEGKKRLI
ncbi:pyridoxamine 5'-phosphate oxidase-related FMN-binding protein [Ferroglobus placidus DSM 10642]|uniref:Pyridoxamine 5'-phosphate oxidase-related FMN-binding protein n=1 Tax=Ferroglobus placidus (strain DSM 10642 / AEDII12DO) TaxID=589924 RepID=D3RZF5_FERPA|nr:pyridoxamine 5'-phosphate oxidase family protein [Ferroglobus placidus]ADC65868.1 pyridoxamine 5'-phosphate oxidase-related FMN-binding protein [Ferroglobus placidus DSM 10642]